ncbi:WD40 repeat domain-containing protein [Coleofasciculus sp. FACHB-SPT36]|uniref:WD40 repeat domain-containing protein n=1 Tax=Coleofasciculus sp. FACHB-SPT36 TaxID=2692790 RepID=UPI00168BD913|nr:WD40 repeat domain-containing protein [Coleofasciculus sp. FACHB-SPT36]MBD2538676.1 WD40 repeat domain-containing protein [Coleofasciculus sp. FACHB-SPT36]
MGKFADKLAVKNPAFQRAYLGHYAPNLVKSGKLEKYYQTLADFDFLAAKINHPEFGVQALIEDYDLADTPEAATQPEYDPEKAEALKCIQGALRLSGHILAEERSQLAGQLLGRLLPSSAGEFWEEQHKYRYFWQYIPWIGRFLPKYPQKPKPQNISQPLVQDLVEQAKQCKYKPWLRPLTGSLTNPNEALLRTLTGHSHSVNAVAVTPDGKLAISGSGDNTLKIWNLATGKLLRTLTGHSLWVNAVAVAPDGKLAISGSYDDTLKIWNLVTGELRHTLTGHSHSVDAIAVTPDGKLAISGSYDNTLKIWNLATGELRHTLTGHSHSVNAVAVTPDGKLAISGSYDNTLKIWNLKTGEVIATFTGESPLLCCAVAPDGVTIVAGEVSGRVHFLRLEGIASP